MSDASIEIVATTVDISPLINQVLIPFAVALGSVLAAWIAAKVAALLGIKREDALAAKLEEAMKNGLALAQARLEERIGTGPINIETKSQLVATAATYARDHVPGTLKALGVTPAALQEKLEARLELNTVPPEQSVAVPTPAATIAVEDKRGGQ